MSLVNILVVDDHDLVRMGIVRILEDVKGFCIVGEAESGEKALLLAREKLPDVILMDVKMPGIGGLEATKKLLRINPDIKIIAVTACDDSVYPGKLMQAGAVGYVTKDAGPEEMIGAINTVVSGKLFMSSGVAQQMALKSYSGTEASPFDVLSDRELQTALAIANGKRAQEIAETFNVSPKTVNSYRYRIFDKLKVNSDVELTLLAVKHSILDPESVV